MEKDTFDQLVHTERMRQDNIWGEQKQIPMVNKATAVEFTQMVVVDFDVMPPGRSEKRNYRPVGLELLRTSSD